MLAAWMPNTAREPTRIVMNCILEAWYALIEIEDLT